MTEKYTHITEYICLTNLLNIYIGPKISILQLHGSTRIFYFAQRIILLDYYI